MDSTMIAEYQQALSDAYKLLHWPLLLLAFLFTKDANVRWTMFLFILLNICSRVISEIVGAFGLPGWLYHFLLMAVTAAYVRWIIVLRPVVSLVVGRFLQSIRYVSLIAMFLPSQYKWQIFPAELAIRRVYVGFIFVHLLALSHYVIYAAGVGWTASGGLFNQLGLSQTVIWDTAFVLNAILNTIELLLLFSLLCSGIKRLTIKA